MQAAHRELLLGTANQDKAQELADLLKGLPWQVRSLTEFPSTEPPVEDGATFEENAVLKAKYYHAAFGIPCIADDSGLEVDALQGAPGVHSARYAGEDCSYADNNRKLLEALEEHPWHERTARFVCCAALLLSPEDVHVERGVVEGHIATACLGEEGFGYDPLFVPSGYDKTFAEMTPDQKHALSHRGAAFRKIRAHLETLG